MVLSRPFHSPTRVYAVSSYAETVGELIANRRWALATSHGWSQRSAIDGLRRFAGQPIAIIDSIPQNPKVSDVLTLSAALPDDVEVIVALGGGSVIDCAKALIGFCGLGRDRDAMMSHLREGAHLPPDFAPRALIAVPTTSGTGSEVTQWATVWGDDQVKFSFTHPLLFPSAAVLDPTLCLSMPADVTLASGLDALSHACESIWNRNHNGVSDELAISAIKLLKINLPLAMANPGDAAVRSHMQTAALLSGLAMGTTQTALAHSISYPFTARFGMPHGFACSFTLPEVARYNAEADADRVAIAAGAFGASAGDFGNVFADWLDRLDLGSYLRPYIDVASIDTLGDNLITRARAANNIRDVDGPIARSLARRSFERLVSPVRRAAGSGH